MYTCNNCQNEVSEIYTGHICKSCVDEIECDTASILKRLDEVVENMGGCIESELCGKDLPNGTTLGCGYCLAFYIKHGRMITEKDLESGVK